MNGVDPKTLVGFVCCVEKALSPVELEVPAVPNGVAPNLLPLPNPDGVPPLVPRDAKPPEENPAKAPPPAAAGAADEVGTVLADAKEF